MPVVRSCIQRALPQHRLVQPANDTGQAAQTTRYVQRVDSGEHIEKGTIGGGGQEEALGAQLQPANIFPGYKEQSQTQRYVQPAGGRYLISPTRHVSADLPACRLQRYAAGN